MYVEVWKVVTMICIVTFLFCILFYLSKPDD